MITSLRSAILALLLMSPVVPVTLLGQCTVMITPSADTICLGGSTTLTAAVPSGGALSTVMGGTNNHRGNMFDLTAINTLTITQFDASPMATTDIAVYYRTGTFVGFENSNVGWTLIGTALGVVPIGGSTPTPVPVPINITIPAGQTYAFYVTSTNTAVSLNYSNGTTLGNVFTSDANLQFKEGKGMEYPFCAGGSPFSPRVWNGQIHYTIPAVSSYLWSTGATTSSITVSPTSTTSYTVTATSGGTCTQTAMVWTGNANADLGPDTSYCAGSPLTLDAGSYTSYIWSNGDTSQQSLSQAGLMWTEVTDAFGCIDRDSILFTENANPLVALGNDTIACGPGFDLNAGNTGSSFVWSNGGSSQIETVTSSGSYSVIVTDANGCTGADTLNLQLGNPSISLGNDVTLCDGASATFSVGAGWPSIAWSTGDTSSSITVNAANTYTAQVTDNLGCNASDTVIVLTGTSPIAAFTVTGNEGCTEATAIALPQVVTSALWLWGDGNTSTGLNPAPHTYAQPYFGDITLIVINDCGSDTVALPFGCTVGLNPATEWSLSVFPNPNEGHFQVSIDGLSAGDVRIEVLNLQGQRVHASAFVANGARFQTALDLGDVAKGSYFLRVRSDSGSATKRIVVQ